MKAVLLTGPIRVLAAFAVYLVEIMPPKRAQSEACPPPSGCSPGREESSSMLVNPAADGRLGVYDVPGLVGGVVAAPVFSLGSAIVTYFRGVRSDNSVIAKRFDGTDTLRFCARCHPEIVVGYACEESDAHAYIKFLSPVSCEFCTAHHNAHEKRKLVPCVVFVDRHQYQMFSTYTGMALPDRLMGKDKPIHGAAIVQLDDRENYNDVSAFLQQHIGTIAALAHTFNVSPGGFGVLARTLRTRNLTMRQIGEVFNGLPRYNEHIEGYSLATQWKLLTTEPYEPSEDTLSLQVTHGMRMHHLKSIFKAFKLGTYRSRLDRDVFIGPMPKPVPAPEPRRCMRNGTFVAKDWIPRPASVFRAIGVQKRDLSQHFARSLFYPRRPLMTLGTFLGIPEPIAPFAAAVGAFTKPTTEHAALAEWLSSRPTLPAPVKIAEDLPVGTSSYLTRVYARHIGTAGASEAAAEMAGNRMRAQAETADRDRRRLPGGVWLHEHPISGAADAARAEIRAAEAADAPAPLSDQGNGVWDWMCESDGEESPVPRALPTVALPPFTPVQEGGSDRKSVV